MFIRRVHRVEDAKHFLRRAGVWSLYSQRAAGPVSRKGSYESTTVTMMATKPTILRNGGRNPRFAKKFTPCDAARCSLTQQRNSQPHQFKQTRPHSSRRPTHQGCLLKQTRPHSSRRPTHQG